MKDQNKFDADSISNLLIERTPLKILGRRHFLLSTAAATAGAIWIKPLHVEAKDAWWKRLFNMATEFAKGILFSNFTGGVPSFLNALIPTGLELMPNGLFGFKQNIVAPGDSPTAAFLQKMLGYLYNTKLLKGFMPYVQKLLDVTGKYLPKDFPINYVTGQVVAALGVKSETTKKTPFNLMQMYLGKYNKENENFKTGLMLPTDKGNLPYQSGISLSPAAIADIQKLVKNPPALYEKYDLIHLTESGTIVAQRSVAENVKKDRSEVDRGQANLQLYIIPAKGDDPDLRKAHKEVVNWLSKPINANYWTNEGKKNELFNDVLPSNSVIPVTNATFEFAREL